ncbi:hypothetical protein ACP4OV_028312 [Aristida adscensionis]
MDRRPPVVVSPRRLRPRPNRVPRPPLAQAASVKTPPASVKKAATPMRASVCAFPSPIRLDPSPLRASISALPPPPRLEPSPPPPRRAKLDLPASVAAAPSPPARTPAGKENLPAAAADDDGAAASLDLASNLAALAKAASSATSPLFVRGRLYDLYSARRNERLKRKQASEADVEAMAEDPCVAVELSKRRGAKKAFAGAATATGAESVRRSMPAWAFASGRANGGAGATPLRSSLRSSKEMRKPSAASGVAAGVSLAMRDRRVTSRSSVHRI